MRIKFTTKAHSLLHLYVFFCHENHTKLFYLLNAGQIFGFFLSAVLNEMSLLVGVHHLNILSK